jgi:hypothetical protein
MFGGGVQFTRDGKSQEIARSVFSEMREIVSRLNPPNESQQVDNSGALPLISVEQAIKELLEMENEINKKES